MTATEQPTPIVRQLGRDDILSHAPRARSVEKIREVLIALDNKEVLMPEQIELRTPSGGELHIKGGYRLGSDYIVFKVATGGFPNGANGGFTMALSSTTGALEQIIVDRGWMTELRTSAAGALATVTLARRGFKKAVILGTGVQAVEQMLTLRSIAPNLQITVWGRNTDKARAIAEEFSVECAESLEHAIRSADAIVTATSSRSPLIPGEWLQPGTHITAIGADMRGKRELSIEALDRADLVICDDVALASHVGELQHAPQRMSGAKSLGSVLAGRSAGRTSDREITVADLCGLGAEDVAIAELVMRRASTDQKMGHQ